MRLIVNLKKSYHYLLPSKRHYRYLKTAKAINMKADYWINHPMVFMCILLTKSTKYIATMTIQEGLVGTIVPTFNIYAMVK